MYTYTILKRFLLILTLALISVTLSKTAQAQQVYGNEWIKYNQTYYKIKVITTGIYRLDYNYLNSLGLAGVNPRDFQLYRRGQEVPIYVSGESDGKLDAQDYIEFFGERNDGALDRKQYKNPAYQVHQLSSMYTDTATYFLTFSSTGGKRMREVNPVVNGKTPEPYHLQKSYYWRNEDYYPGVKRGGGNRMPWMDRGEGRFTNTSRFENSYKLDGIINVETTGPKPNLQYSVYARNDIVHNFAVRVVGANNVVREIARHQIVGDGHAHATFRADFSDINEGVFNLRTVPDLLPPFEDGSEDKRNQVSVPHAILTFPQKTVFQGSSMFFYTDSSRVLNPYFEFANAPATTIAYDVTDKNNIYRTEGYAINGNRGYVVNANDGRSHKMFLADVSKALIPIQAQKISFRSIDPAAHNYIILTNKRLMAAAGGASVPAPKEYAAYRASAAGGSYDTLLVFINDVIDQFHYGEYSSYAINNFLHYMSTSAREKQLLILGKGSDPMVINYKDASQRRLDLVPTGGSPGSDIVFSADFHNNSYIPKIPTGRVSATSPADIINYLNKVKEYEAQVAGQPWQKKILQLGGGATKDEINRITSYLSSYKTIAEGPLLGANVIERYRQNVSQMVENINVSEEVNAGLSLLTFFGHSSTSTTDLDIGYASNPINGYKNKGKYPVILMNGCNTGFAFQPNNVSFGEDWINTPDKGAIAFIAHVDIGYPDKLHLYSANFYATAFQDEAFYGKPLGLIQQQVIKRITESMYEDDDRSIAMALEMLLQGDPVVKLYSPDKPDYYVKANGFDIISKDNSPVLASSPAFILKVSVGNLGKAITDSVYVSVKRTLADNTVIQKDTILVKPIIRDDTLLISLSNEGINALGRNTFEVKLDHPDAHPELKEDNNIGQFQHYFSAGGLVALSPGAYNIVADKKVKLSVQSTQLQLNRQGVYFEIDTTQAFNSNLKRTFTADNNYLPSWEVTLPDTQDSTVYYWRARFTTYEAGEDTVWAGSSFRYINNSKGGWSQSHYGQFNEVQAEGISNVGKNNLKWEFNPFKADIEIRTVGGDVPFKIPAYNLILNGRPLINMGCSDPSNSSSPRFIMIVLDNRNLEPVHNLVPAMACATSPYLYDTGNINSATNRAKLETFMKAVPDSFYVAAISINKVPFSLFTASQKQAFNSIGSNLINTLATGHPFAIVGQKGAAPGSAQELTASAEDPTPATSQNVILKVRLQSRQQAGTLTSTTIGPALSWGTLFHNIERYQDGDDKYKLSVIGINKEGGKEVLVDSVTSKAFDISTIDVKQFPELQLRAFLSDSTARTAPQLKEWFVYYEAPPEGVIRPDLVQVNDQLLTEQANRGSITVPMAFQNVTPIAFSDSVTVEVTVTGEGIQPIVSRFKIEPLQGNATANFEFKMPTVSLSGNYKLSMYVNPRVLPEQQYFNNIFEETFSVKARLHPILDVAFDGVHILDGELVSSSPMISITVKDENRHVFLQDPSGMSVVLVAPDGVEKEVSLTGNPQEVRYFPADEKNDFKVEYKPNRLETGKYTLVVRARDVAGNSSGISPYRISFEVDNEAKISNFYPYPNPFSTKTQFIFTLTGSTVPDDLKIQILTVTGKVVKEIMKEELGPLRIGNNKTEYAWDGTDTYGDKLANGVYLYRVIMSKGEEEVKHKNTFGDKAFKNGYGKLYILR